jgi:hypothetical protein
MSHELQHNTVFFWIFSTLIAHSPKLTAMNLPANSPKGQTMNYRRGVVLFGVMMLMTVSGLFGSTQGLTGSAKVKLSGQVTKEQMDQCKANARFKLKPELITWLEEQKNIHIDTTDMLANLLFNNFLDSCIAHTKENPAFKEGYWTFSYSLQPKELETALASFNDRIELLAVHSWKRLENAVEQKNYEEIYYQSVEVIAYATSYMGPPLTVKGDSNKILIEEGRSILKNFLEHIDISSSGQIIEGKPGYQPINPTTMRIMIDGQPFAGLGITGYIPGGPDVFTGVADNNGAISFDNIIIPFIKNGTMMYVAPNLGRVLNNEWRIGIKDFGIKLKNDLNQLFFFKITRPTYTLKYEAIATDQTDTIPKDIASGASLRKFLADSCFFQPATEGAKADLNITVSCKISSANANAAIDLSAARFESTVSIQAPMLTPPRTERETLEFEKKYDKFDPEYSSKDYDKFDKAPLGFFLWDANLKLHGTFRKILDRL